MSVNFSHLGFLRVAAHSPRVTIGDPMANVRTILELIEDSDERGISIALFPELAISGYSAEDLFFSESLIANTVRALETLCQSAKAPMLVVGAPWRLADGRLLNCAVVIADGAVRGMVPKSMHPNYAEFYDLRWFAGGANVNETVSHPTLGQFAIRTDQLFALSDHLIGIEVCEDLWAPEAPGTKASLAGASILLNLSASNELIAKADYRRDLVRMASAKALCAYVYSSAGSTESTKDVVYGGHCLVTENGQLLAESDRFNLESHMIVADVDTARLTHDRMQNITFGQAPRPESYRIVRLAAPIPALPKLERDFPAHPFVPDDEHEFAARAQEILSIQATGLARRMLAARSETLVIGLSGGLDSTLAFLVCLDALAKLELPPKAVHAITMPGPGTTARTKGNAHALAEAADVELREIPIEAAVTQHLADLEHEGDHDIVYENAQARERTQILFNYANKVGGIVVGTGDLSELALGWCTYNADHMASYNVNASVPKTMMAYLVRWYAAHRASDDLARVLGHVLETPISPELIPPEEGEISQKTESIIGPYELHDFFLYHFLRTGASPTKIYELARTSFAGDYSGEEIKKWLTVFFQRFMSQQFKRTTLPPGPKVGTVSLSPRGDWRMPDEASAGAYLREIEELDR
jgi:NAD+ synthase (glutamine-hydrolysing)